MMPEPISTSNPQQSAVCATVSAPMDPVVVHSATPVARTHKHNRDSSWLKLEVCREHIKPEGCVHGDNCMLAHPQSPIGISEGDKVTCCYDFLKDRCHRDHCKYFHPPTHIKERLVSAGKQFGAMMSSFSSMAISSTLPMPMIPPPVPFYGGERLQYCPDYMLGQCAQAMCPLVHPEHSVRTNGDGTVTVCRDFVRSTGCPRDQCRFYHPSSYQVPQSGFVPPQGMYVPMMAGYHQPGPVYYQPSSQYPTPSLPSASIPRNNIMYLSAPSPPLFVPFSFPVLQSHSMPAHPTSLTPQQSVSSAIVSSPPFTKQTILSTQPH